MLATLMYGTKAHAYNKIVYNYDSARAYNVHFGMYKLYILTAPDQHDHSVLAVVLLT